MERSQFIFAVSVGLSLMVLGGVLATINSIGIAHLVIGGVIVSISVLVPSKSTAAAKSKQANKSFMMSPVKRVQRIRDSQ